MNAAMQEAAKKIPPEAAEVYNQTKQEYTQMFRMLIDLDEEKREHK
jgi:hypothetical protein